MTALRAGRWRLIAGIGAVGLMVLLADVPAWASDVFSNVAPPPQVPGGSLVNAYPLGNYSMDIRFSAVDAGVFSGIDASGIPPTIAWLLAEIVWEVTSFLANVLVLLFAFAFSLDLVGGSAETGGAGALEPVAQATGSIYRNVFGEPWLVLAILLTGLWALWHALVRRRYTETASALGVSLVFLVIALAFVTQPERTIGQASRWSNEMSGAFLSLSSEGSIGDPARAKRNAADQLFALLVYEPWVVLQFGGREHCVRDDGTDDPGSVPVRPLSRDGARDAELSRRLAASAQVRAEGKVCINHRHKYAPRFLRHRGGSKERRQHYEALRDGDTDKAPEADRDGYSLSAADKPAAEAMQKDGQYQRLLMALVIFAAELGAFLLLGALSVSVILAQVLALTLLAFAPVALVIGVFPGRGHDFFRNWLSRLAALVLRKAIYSLILAVLLAVAGAVAQATSALGWLMSFGLQAGFFWAVFLLRRQLLGQLTRATTGHTGSDGAAGVRVLSAYAAARFAHRTLRARPRRKPTPPRGAQGAEPLSASEPGPEDAGVQRGKPSNREHQATPNAATAAHPVSDAASSDAPNGSADGPPAHPDLPQDAPDRRQSQRRRDTDDVQGADAARPDPASPEPGPQAAAAPSRPGSRGSQEPRRPAEVASGESPLRDELRADAQRVHGAEAPGAPERPAPRSPASRPRPRPKRGPSAGDDREDGR